MNASKHIKAIERLYFLRINEQNNKSPLQSNNPLTCALPLVISFNYIQTAHRYEHLLCVSFLTMRSTILYSIKANNSSFLFYDLFHYKFQPKIETFPLRNMSYVQRYILLFCPWNYIPNVSVSFYQNFVQ